MKDVNGSMATQGRVSRRQKNDPSSQSQLPSILCNALQAHLAAGGKTLTIGEDGVFHLEDGDTATSREVFDLAWRDGYIRVAKNGDLILLVADRISFDTDMPKVRRRLEEKIRNDWEPGMILEVALRIGVPVG